MTYTATYTYSAANELTNETDPNSTYAYTFDANGRLSVVDNNGTPGVPHLILTYSYDGWDMRTNVKDNLGGSITYTYDDPRWLGSTEITGAPK